MLFLSFLKPLIVNYTIMFSLAFNLNLLAPFKDNKEKLTKRQFLVYSLGFSFTGVLCMLYPIESLGETNFDLRMVLILVGAIYFGLIPSFIIFLIISIGRIIIGGEFVFLGLLINFTAFVVPHMFKRFFNPFEKQFLIRCIAFYFVYFIITNILVYNMVPFVQMSFLLTYNTAFFATYLALLFLLEKLKDVNRQVEEATYLQNVHTIGQMAAAFAHEIRNPITTVRGFIQYLSTENHHKDLSKFSPLILEELDRTNQVITDYLQLAKPRKPIIDSFMVDRIVKDTISMVAPSATFQGIRFEQELSPHLFMKADGQHVKQCLLNILLNSVEASPPNSVINVSSGICSKKLFAFISVTDYGVGMTTEELEKVGILHYTTKTTGTGIGSMVVNRLLREMNGSVKYESVKNEFTKVTMFLPLHQD
ncbi:ATP-binding protein [Mangrovibacillus cuniculi]|uniref:histidine kinase n=1 Tax=Mangrovibacillus cuniculi TaxID=2593652 RepID=A0A7S8HF90_9BACI|nr:ATP-binding protein [Mangrovibacillus cuniculi]QPC46568.1 two-component sensor histidine kinase [Mangrovibacillus cuniculi]